MKITYSKIVKGVRYLKHYGFKEFVIRLQEKMEAEEVPYEPWYEKHRATQSTLDAQRKKSQGWNDAPCISIVVPLYCTNETFLREMIASVQAQSYENWELCLADASPAAGSDQTTNDGLYAIVSDCAGGDVRVRYRALPENRGIAENTNAAIEMANGSWIAFLDHDDLLAPDALYEAVRLIRRGNVPVTEADAPCCRELGRQKAAHTEYEMIYTDEDKVDVDGVTHFQPHLKPDINIDLLRSNNYITHFLLVRRSLFERVGRLDPAFDGAQDHDFILRCAEEASAVGHVPRILYHWRSHRESTAENPFAKQYAVDAGKRAIEAHLKRTGTAGTVTSLPDLGFYRVQYPVQGEPLVSIVIPNKDETDTLQKCLDSIAASAYQNYEVIIVENNSSAETFSYYRTIAPNESQEEGTRIFAGQMPGGQSLRVVVWEKSFNYSAINNFGVSFAQGSYLLLLNNDITLIGSHVIGEMLGTCERQEVGIVGARLYYPDDTVQHAGIVVGIGGNARGIGQNMFGGLAKGRSGYLHKAALIMDYSAVTAACLMVKASVYHEVGGMEEQLAVAFNDVDFCLKVRKIGYLVVYQPYAECHHDESKSRGAEDTKEKTDRFQREIEYMRNHWIKILKEGDPYYNPNFTRVYANYSLRDL
jgi:GT2 family glycosyltransferase